MSDIFAPVVRHLVQTAEKAHVPDPSDYMGENGMLICGKCHTPKECTIDFPQLTTVRCMCRCATEEFNGKMEEERRSRIAEFALSEAFDDPAQRKWDVFRHDDGKTPQLTEAIRRYCDNFDHFRKQGRGLLLWSKNSGSGKSYYAASVVNELCRRGVRCRMTTFGRIFADLGSTYRYDKSEYIDRLISRELLVIDDLSAESASDWSNEHIFNIVDGRYRAKHPTIFTTNLSIEQIKKPGTAAAQRIYDRILEMCHPINVICDSRRLSHAASEYMNSKEILGM